MYQIKLLKASQQFKQPYLTYICEGNDFLNSVNMQSLFNGTFDYYVATYENRTFQRPGLIYGRDGCCCFALALLPAYNKKKKMTDCGTAVAVQLLLFYDHHRHTQLCLDINIRTNTLNSSKVIMWLQKIKHPIRNYQRISSYKHKV